jgi:threonine dehydrogenase-like Zn-dependent dehydrogenase
MGATQTLNVESEDVVKRMLAERTHEGIDVVFECVGVEQSIRDSIAIVRKGGKIVVCGVFGTETKIRMADVQDRELEIIGTIMYVRRDIRDAMQMLASGRIETGPFISREYSLEEAQEAFAASLDTEQNVKVIFRIGENA